MSDTAMVCTGIEIWLNKNAFSSTLPDGLGPTYKNITD
jgi:hypothetical protein